MSAGRIFSRLSCVASLISSIGSKLVIEGPDPLYQVFAGTNGEIQASYANFGHIPYGQTLVSYF